MNRSGARPSDWKHMSVVTLYPLAVTLCTLNRITLIVFIDQFHRTPICRYDRPGPHDTERAASKSGNGPQVT